MTDNLQAVAGLTPEPVWRYFAKIAEIPRGSKNEAAIAAFVMDTAKRLGLVARQDTAGNVIVQKPASPGREHVRSVCLQGHLDMVCEKNKTKDFDFTKDGIELVRHGNAMMANGTTLGADNGIAVATHLAIMEDNTLTHGPLELLFTIDEETGLTGANALAPDFVKSRTLLNLDSEEEGALYVGCSGGRDALGTFKVDFEAAPQGTTAVLITVKGLKGGHSGLDIDKGRGNAIRILNRVLLELAELGMRLAAFNGGNKRNAIPREAEALVLVPSKKLDAATAVVTRVATAIKLEFGTVEPQLDVTCTTPQGKRAKVIKKSQQKRLLMTLAALPHGVLKMSADIPGLVETSTNLAVIETNKKAIVVATSQRSSVASEIDEASMSVCCTLDLGGAKVKPSEGYPGWKPNMQSEILALAKGTYRRLFGNDPHVKAIHAGLECGIIGEKCPGIDMVSMGPTLEAVHSPDEKIFIDTVPRFWQFLTAVLGGVT